MPFDSSKKPVPVICLSPKDCGSCSRLDPFQENWLAQNGFSGQAGRLLAFPGEDGSLAGYVFGLGREEHRDPMLLGSASAQLPGGSYKLLASQESMGERNHLAFLLGSYRFERYKSVGEPVRLDDSGNDFERAGILKEAAFIARDLINIPANDLGPDALEQYARDFAREREFTCDSITGDELLKENFPMIHAVGRASRQAPRLLDLRWGPRDAARVTLVGKGVAFDTGGLNLKPASSMALMKKDMGGAANVLGLAHAIARSGLKLHLRVLLPVVENSVSGNSFRPGDILKSRSGMSVEIGNTDAEGRLILADAISLACEEKPQMLIDMATLTGAARVALGPEISPLYTKNRQLAGQLSELGEQWGDPLWPMPLWHPYDKNLSSCIADVSHIASGGFAGSITAALFLQRFVGNVDDWLHLDIFGWAPKDRPARPCGGTDQGIISLFMMLEKKFSR